MLTNGKASCTSNSKHVSIKYFWSTDRIKNGNMSVEYCSTHDMLADFMSKPVQGMLFTKFRKVIMGWEHMSTLFEPHDPNVERVGNNVSLTLGAKKPRITYADAVRSQKAVDLQNDLINRGIDPTDGSIISLKRNNPVSIHL